MPPRRKRDISGGQPAYLDFCLSNIFKIRDGFRYPQKEVIRDLLGGRRVLLIQPTGWGKSLCYQMAAYARPGVALVFSPLKALMKDQCERCSRDYGMAAAWLDSSFSAEENDRTLADAVKGRVKLLYVAPERLDNRRWRELWPKIPISLLVIDEAHCISAWGHDFRPDYRRITGLVDRLRAGTPILCTTATANARVEKDIALQIGGSAQIGADVRVYRGGMTRPNLRLSVLTVEDEADKLAYLARKLGKIEGPGIVYIATRSEAESVSRWLIDRGIKAACYHAGMDEEERKKVQDGFMENRYHTICATVALGMGIDKPNIRFVIHYHVPGSPVLYYQEIGRAGRDGRPARCILLFHEDDLGIQRFFIENAKPDQADYERVVRALRDGPMKKFELLAATGLPETALRNILSDLEDMRVAGRDRGRQFVYLDDAPEIDLSFYEPVRRAREIELGWMEEYARLRRRCLMRYLARCLGDEEAQDCGACSVCTGVWDRPGKGTALHAEARRMLEGELPRLEPRRTAHRMGFALAYHIRSQIGKTLSKCKYRDGGDIPQWIVDQAVEVLAERYPLRKIDMVVSVPPTISGGLVEDFARRVAEGIRKPYHSVLRKIRATRPQKEFRNSVTKERNLAGAFEVGSPEAVADRGVLLIDDIWDSGKTFLVVGRTLKEAGAAAVWPLAITRTSYKQDR